MKELFLNFRNRETGKELAGYTLKDSFPGELDATRELLAFEQGITPEQIEIYIADRAGKTPANVPTDEAGIKRLVSLIASFPAGLQAIAAKIAVDEIERGADPEDDDQEGET